MYINNHYISNLEDLQFGLTMQDPGVLFSGYSCSPITLNKRGRSLLNDLSKIFDSPKINQGQTKVVFMNWGIGSIRTQDIFHLCYVNTGGVIYTVIPRLMCYGANKGKSEVYGWENGTRELLVIGTWADVENFFMVGDVNIAAV